MINENEDFENEIDRLFEICQTCKYFTTITTSCESCPVKKQLEKPVELLSKHLGENKQKEE